MTALAAPTLDPVPTAAPPRRARPLRALIHKPVAVVCLGYLAILLAVIVIVPLLPGFDPNEQHLLSPLAGPSAQHWLGTDRLGRDIGLRLIAGGRAALEDVLIAAAAFLLAGVPLAVLAGYRGGWLDRLVMRVADLMFAIPAIVILLMVVAVFPNSDPAAMITLGLLSAPGLMRIVRGVTVATRGELYVTAARLSGLRTAALLRRHILPALLGPIVVQLSLFIAGALIAESGLSFLGLLRPDASGPTWGNMVADAATALSQDAWFLVPTGGIIALTVIAFSLLGDAVRDVTAGQPGTSTRLLGVRRRPIERRPPATADAGSDQRGSLLTVSGLTVVRDSGEEVTTLVQDVSFSVARGETVGIVGESGCGKTLTARAILGLLPPGLRTAAGSVRFEDTELLDLADRELARVRGAGIGLVLQDPINSLDPTFTVESQLREVIRAHRRIGRAEADRRAVELLEMVRLPEPAVVMKRRVHELSGGMAQRVGVALALAGEPKLLIADEPTTALDVTVQAEILALLRDLSRELHMALIVITHDWGVLADVCERTIVMYAGEIVETGGVEDIYAAPLHPYSAALLACNPQLSDPGEPLPIIAGTVPDPSRWPRGCHFGDRCRYATDACMAGRVPLEIHEHGRAARCVRVDDLTAKR